MASLAFAFSFLLRFQIENYPVYFLAGSLFWTFFSQATGHAANLSTEALEITKQVYVPRSAFVASAVGGAAMNLVLSLLPLLVIVLASGHPVHLTWLFLPVSLVIGAAFMVLSQMLESGGQLFALPPWLIGWTPTIALAGLTSVMLWRTR